MGEKIWDEAADRHCTIIFPGEIFVTDEFESISAVVGSNVAVCLRDTNSGIGGMSNFLFARSDDSRFNDWSENFSTYMLDTLGKTIISLGGNKVSFEAKLFGGADIVANTKGFGKKNVTFVTKYFQKRKITIVSESTGGKEARKVHFTPINGAVDMRKIAKTPLEIHEQESKYRDKVKLTGSKR